MPARFDFMSGRSDSLPVPWHNRRLMPADGEDLLSDVLQDAGLRARIVGSFGTTADRGFSFPGTFDAALHVALRGSIWVSGLPKDQRLERGDVALLPSDFPCLVGGNADAHPLLPPKEARPPRVVNATVGPATALAFRALTAGYEYENPRVRPILGFLPKTLHFRLPEALVNQADEIADRTTDRSSGMEFSILRQAEGLFCDVLALAIARVDAPSSLLPALRDQNLTPVLQAIHARPAEDWTLQEMANLAGLSRTVFCRRFSLMTGVGAIEYVRKVRIRQGVALLRNTTLGVAEVATAVGYESESSFSRAFLAVTGQRPGKRRTD